MIMQFKIKGGNQYNMYKYKCILIIVQVYHITQVLPNIIAWLTDWVEHNNVQRLFH